MIDYQTSSSIFFNDNKKYCEDIELIFSELNINSVGYCNSYGFEINANFRFQEFDCKLYIFKNQSTQNGVVIPVDAIDTIGCNFLLKNLPKDKKFNIRNSKILRFFLTREMKNSFPFPYFIKFYTKQNQLTMSRLSEFCLNYNVLNMKLKKGELEIKTLKKIDNPILLIKEIVDIVD